MSDRHDLLTQVWTTMRAHYGTAFDRQWQAPTGATPEQVKLHVQQLKAVWLRTLEHVAPEAMDHALERLPDQVPTLPQFKALCLTWLRPETRALPPPKADPERLKRELAKLNQHKPSEQHDRTAWAHDTLARHRRGECSTTAAEMARRALQAVTAPKDLRSVEPAFKPIPDAALPPGMRSASEPPLVEPDC